MNAISDLASSVTQPPGNYCSADRDVWNRSPGHTACNAMLCNVLPCDVVLICDIMLCDVILCDLRLCKIMLCKIMLCNVMQHFKTSWPAKS